ncbi:hypothetical protein MRX96_003909 [Rhipicephalus microplus]
MLCKPQATPEILTVCPAATSITAPDRASLFGGPRVGAKYALHASYRSPFPQAFLCYHGYASALTAHNRLPGQCHREVAMNGKIQLPSEVGVVLTEITFKEVAVFAF